MRLEQLEYLIAIHENHSINIASQKLHVSQQSVSKAIQNLEAELQTTLLERTKKGTSLTPEGKIAVQHAQNIFQEINMLKTNLQQRKAPQNMLTGSLNIVYSQAFDMEQLFSSSCKFAADYPYVNFSCHQKSIASLLEMVHTEEADIGLMISTDQYHLNSAIEGMKLKDLIVVSFMQENLLAAISVKSPLSKQKSISIKTLLKEPIILLQNDDDNEECNWLVQLLRSYGNPNFAMKVTSKELYLKAIADNVGIGFSIKSAGRFSEEENLTNIISIPIRPAVSLCSSYVFNCNHENDSLVRAFLPYLASDDMQKY